MKKKVKIPWRIYIVYLAVVSLVVSGVTLSRYKITGTATDTARVAKFEYEITGGHDGNQEFRLDVSLPATVKLGVPVGFNEGVDCKEITITNSGECSVYLKSVIDEEKHLTDTGILWRVLFDDPHDDYHSSIVADLGTETVGEFSQLQTTIEELNAQTLQDLEDIIIKNGESQTFYIVFWAEYSQLFNQSFAHSSDTFIDFTVEQVE